MSKSWLKIILSGFLLITAVSAFFLLSGYFAAKNPVSYLPVIKAKDLQNHSGRKKIQLENPWFILGVDSYGGVTIKTIKGEIIMSSLTYYSAYKGANENWGLDKVTVTLSNDSTVLILGKGPMDVHVSMSLMVHKSKPKMDVNIKTQYNLNTIVNREAVIAKFDVPLTEVYLKNRKSDIKPFESEYWIQKQGLRFGKGLKSSLIYHTPHISSLQVDSKSKLLFINLEYFLDHPLINIPYQKDATGKWIDCSAANYSPGSERNDSFTIYFGSLPEATPRLMLVPHGYLAGYIFTEHADGGTIRTHRAAYFGSENISNFENATGGFVGHKIPVTKSVFYADTSRGHPQVSTIRDGPDNEEYVDFLDQLNSTGLYDIGLHTPEWYSSNRETLAEAIEFMKNRFDTKTWIDHGMFGGDINRETLVGDGLNPNSVLYAADLWEEFGTSYFWSPAVEALHKTVSPKEELKKLRLTKASGEIWNRYRYLREYKQEKLCHAFFELLKGYFPIFELNSLQHFKGNSYPTPLYWQNITKTRHFYSWTTEFVYFGFSPDMAIDKINDEKRQLDLLNTNWGVFFNHGYYVRNHKRDFFLSEHNGEFVINPHFDEILRIMASMRDEGNLFITTVRELLDYWVLTENVSFEYLPDGTIYVYNNNNVPINGLSLAIHASDVRINDETPKFRQVEDDIIFWFDIRANDHVVLKAKIRQKD